MKRFLAVLVVLAAAGVAVLMFGDRGTGLDLEAISSCTRPRVAPSPEYADAPAPASVGFTRISDISDPIAVDRWPDGRLVVGQRPGTVVLMDESGDTETILDITDRIVLNAEGGLLGMTVDPQGRHLYLHHTDVDGVSRILAFRIIDGALDVSSEREILSQPHPGLVHNGGHLLFGPDGMLYIGFGDGTIRVAGALDSESRETLAGKLLRIDPTPDADLPYSIPGDNPDAKGLRGAPEIFAQGFRNPWRFSFDRQTGDLWIGDVGNDCWEEIDLIPAGSSDLDFGWPRYEGRHAMSTDEDDGSSTFPVLELPHHPACAVIGGYVYRGEAIPGLRGSYIYQDLCEGELRWLRPTSAGTEGGTLGARQDFVLAFWEDEAGELFVLTATDGILEIVSAAVEDSTD